MSEEQEWQSTADDLAWWTNPPTARLAAHLRANGAQNTVFYGLHTTDTKTTCPNS